MLPWAQGAAENQLVGITRSFGLAASVCIVYVCDTLFARRLGNDAPRNKSIRSAFELFQQSIFRQGRGAETRLKILGRLLQQELVVLRWAEAQVRALCALQSPITSSKEICSTGI